MKNRVLILGGNGFIGRNLSLTLRNLGYQVISFDMCIPSDYEEGIQYIQGDFFDDDTLLGIIPDVDIIYHAISTVNPGNSNRKYLQGYERDFIQTVKLCGWISEKDIKMIFLSSGGTVYGHQEEQPIKESSFAVPINHYGNIKLCIENTIRTFNFQNKSNIIVARISNPYGPGQDYHKGVGFVDAVLKNAISNTPVEIWGDGEIIRDYIYIQDVCNMLVSLATYTGEFEVFNLSSKEGTSQNQIIDLIRKKDESLVVEYKEYRSVDVKKIILDNSRIMSIYNEEIVTINKGLELYYNYLKK